MSPNPQKHWTAESTNDFRFSVGADFIDQIEHQMMEKGWLQKDLAAMLGKSESWVSQFFNNPGNMSLSTMIEFGSVLGLKVGVLAYNDEDEINRRGPINSVVFQRCWKLLGKPRDQWDIDERQTTWRIQLRRTSTIQAVRIPAAWNLLGAHAEHCDAGVTPLCAS